MRRVTPSLNDDRPLWDQLTLFGPPAPKHEPAPPLQLDFGWDGGVRNASVLYTADLIDRMRDRIPF